MRTQILGPGFDFTRIYKESERKNGSVITPDIGSMIKFADGREYTFCSTSIDIGRGKVCARASLNDITIYDGALAGTNTFNIGLSGVSAGGLIGRYILLQESGVDPKLLQISGNTKSSSSGRLKATTFEMVDRDVSIGTRYLAHLPNKIIVADAETSAANGEYTREGSTSRYLKVATETTGYMLYYTEDNTWAICSYIKDQPGPEGLYVFVSYIYAAFQTVTGVPPETGWNIGLEDPFEHPSALSISSTEDNAYGYSGIPAKLLGSNVHDLILGDTNLHIVGVATQDVLAATLGERLYFWAQTKGFAFVATTETLVVNHFVYPVASGLVDNIETSDAAYASIGKLDRQSLGYVVYPAVNGYALIYLGY